jgi:hypothetical protein
LLPGGNGIVEFTAANPDGPASKQVTAAITLPPGVSYVDPPIAGGWTCQTASAGATCVHAPLAPGTTATGYLPVAVAANAPTGTPPSIAVSAGGPVVAAQGKVGVAASGLGARFAATGPDTVVIAGSPFCGFGLGHEIGLGRNWGTASTADLRLPGRVVWAGLYWAGVRSRWPDHDQVDAAANIEVSGPGAEYQRVDATQIGEVTSPDGRVGFEAFADVTSLVARYGTGAWTAVPGFAPGTADFGWTLVVVTADPAAAPGTQVMVLDGAHVVDADNPDFAVPLDALPPGRQTQVQAVTWTPAGPRLAAFAQNLAESPVVNFTTTDVPYLVGVVAVTDPPGAPPR